METKAMKVELNAPNRELDFLATNRRKYRKYNPEGVSKVVGNGAYLLAEFKGDTVFVNRGLCNRADFRNILKVTHTKLEVVFVDHDPWKERELHNAKRCENNADILTDYWKNINKRY